MVLVIAYVASLLIQQGVVGDWAHPTRRALALVLLGLLVLRSLVLDVSSRAVPLSHRGAAGVLRHLVSLLLLLAPAWWEPSELAAPLTALLLLTLTVPPEEERFRLPLVVGGLLYGGLVLMEQHVAFFSGELFELSIRLTHSLGKVAGHPVWLGPTPAGLWTALLALCVIVAAAANPGRGTRWRAIVGVVLVAAVWVLQVMFGDELVIRHLYSKVAHLLSSGAHEFNPARLVFLPTLMALVAMALVAGWVAASSEGGPTIAKHGLFSPGRRPLIMAGLGVLVLFLSTFTPWSVRVPRRAVLLHGDPMAFGGPSPSQLGIQNAGMFGVLLERLTDWGYDVHVADPKRGLRTRDLASVQTLVMINPSLRLEKPALDRIYTFVKRGGSLLVLGDHTDVFGTQAPLNALLAPIGVAFRFDSAFPLRREWKYCYRVVGPHPAFGDVAITNQSFQYSTGASLLVRPPARPVVVGRFAFSDLGDRKNAPSFLGDYLYSIGEILGDVPVIAEASVGRGRVVVFGDTSPFQTVALAHAGSFVSKVFDYLSRSDPSAWIRIRVRTVALEVMVALIAVLLLGTRWPERAVLGAVALAMIAAGSLSQALTQLTGAHRPPSAPTAWIDAAHLNGFDLAHWKDRSADGLALGLQRLGYHTEFVTRPGFRNLEGVATVIIIEPQRRLTNEECARLTRFVREGGRALLAVGPRGAAAVAGVLDAVGLRVDDLPLGPVPITYFIEPSAIDSLARQPHFAEAWPVVEVGRHSDEPNTIPGTLYSSGGWSIVVSRQLGRGQVIVIGDARYLHDRNLETEKAGWPGNVEFVAALVGRHPSTSPQPISP